MTSLKLHEEPLTTRIATKACAKLGLAPEVYKETFEQIAEDWETTLGTATYLEPFIGTFLLNICKTSEGFLGVFRIILDRYSRIYKLMDGSQDFAQVVIEELKSGRIKSADDLLVLCIQLEDANTAFRESKEGSNGYARNGSQFHRFIEAIRAQVREV